MKALEKGKLLPVKRLKCKGREVQWRGLVIALVGVIPAVSAVQFHNTLDYKLPSFISALTRQKLFKPKPKLSGFR